MLQPIYEDATLVPTTTPSVSGWENVEQFDTLRVVKTHTTGTYALTIEWSNDGVTADVTETVTVVNNDAVDQPVASKFARFTVTATVANFTTHKTSIYGRTGIATIIPITEMSGDVLVGTPMVGAWKNVEDYFKIRLFKTSTGGTYAATADWSDDAQTIDQTETLAIPNNDQYEEDPKGRYMRLTVTATGSTVANHKTEASGVLRQ